MTPDRPDPTRHPPGEGGAKLEAPFPLKRPLTSRTPLMRPSLRLWIAAPRLTALALVLLFASMLRADDWPQFRGPARDAIWHESDLLDAFPPGGPAVRWRTPVGISWSSPIIHQGHVFVTDADLHKPDADERLHCLDEATGKILWTFSSPAKYPEWAFVPGQGNGPVATPIAEGSRVWTLGVNGEVHCVDAASGDVIWKRLLDQEFTIQSMVCRPSPLLDGDRLIVFTGAKPGASVMALDKNTGMEIWQALDEPVLNSSPILITVRGKRQLVVWTGETVSALDPDSGATLWSERLITSSNDGTSTPVFHDNRLLIGGLMLEFREGADAPVILWPTDTKAVSKRVLSNTCTALFRDEHVYSALSRGQLVCLDASTGKELWRTDTVTKIGNGASINICAVAGSDKAFLFTDEGNFILARLSPSGYQEISRAHVIEPTTPFSGMKAWSPPAYANGCVFIRNDNEIICLSLRKTP